MCPVMQKEQTRILQWNICCSTPCIGTKVPSPLKLFVSALDKKGRRWRQWSTQCFRPIKYSDRWTYSNASTEYLNKQEHMQGKNSKSRFQRDCGPAQPSAPSSTHACAQQVAASFSEQQYLILACPTKPTLVVCNSCASSSWQRSKTLMQVVSGSLA